MSKPIDRVPAPDRLYTWVDIDEHFARLAEAGQWPKWLKEADSFWDGTQLIVQEGTAEAEILEWTREVFGPTSLSQDDGAWFLHLENVPGEVPTRVLPLIIDTGLDAPDVRPLQWRNSRVVPALADPIPEPSGDFENGVRVVAFHSFKGGVGRTLHAVALAEALSKRTRVLLVDGDLEAPGITWMYEGSGKRIDFAYEDLLALLQGSFGDDSSDSVALASSFLSNQTVGNIAVMPARRHVKSALPSRISPADLSTSSRSRYFLSESLAKVASKIGASVVIVDLRAGVSELSAPLLLDPRVQRVFVTTTSAQSLTGTELLVVETAKRAPTRVGDPAPKVVVTQFRASETEDYLANLTSPLMNALAAISDETAEDATTASIESAPVFTQFDESLLGLPHDWDGVIALVNHAGLTSSLLDLASEVDPTDQNVRANVPQSMPVDGRQKLAAYARTLAYAETTESQDFLPTDALRNLVMAHRTDAPLCVVAGSKGAGKTFTQLQMTYRETWQKYADAVGIDGVTLQASLVPVLTSQNLMDDTAARIDALRSVAGFGPELATRLEIRDLVRSALSLDYDDREWRGLWLMCLARAAGLAADIGTAEDTLVAAVAQYDRPRIFLIDGLEDLLQDVATDAVQQKALRVLLTDTLDWLRSLRGRPLGLIIFVRRDLVKAAVPQNSAQFLARYKDYELAWDATEAIRLAWWVGQKSGALVGAPATEIASARDDQLTEVTQPLWGEKMGTEKSREARSSGWFIAALSDFNGRIQARDIVTFLKTAAEKSTEDTRWQDRILVPVAMREALVVCSQQKIDEIGEETPQIRDLLQALRSLPNDQRQVPFSRDFSKLSPTDLQLLEDNGILFREEDRYWIPEIFRHGLGFRANGRPRIVAVANLVRKRNNQD